MQPERLSDPGATARIGYAGDARRLKPEHHWQQLGPWAGEVTVTPLELERKLVFEVTARWGHGADQTKPDVPGLVGLPVRTATDVIALDSLEHAQAVAMRAVDELRAGQVPDLPAIARIFDLRF